MPICSPRSTPFGLTPGAPETPLIVVFAEARSTEGATSTPRSAASPATTRLLDSCGRLSVLHVDDDPAFSSVTGAHLERASYPIDVTSRIDVDTALEYLASDRDDPDCIVSDFQMPGRDGLEFLAAIRRLAREVPFILFTGTKTKFDDRVSGLDGPIYYLDKGCPDAFGRLADMIVFAVEERNSA